MTIEYHNTAVNLSGLLEVLGQNLYSQPEVAIRELIQNAHDSITRRRIEEKKDFEASITLIANNEEKTITVKDTGAGLTKEEMIKYLATIGSGYTRILRQQTEDESLIGKFGLGFLTAYMVSNQVEVKSFSYQTQGLGVKFLSKDGQRYALNDLQGQEIGTSVILHLKPEYYDLADESYLFRVLKHYCALLPIPIYLGHNQNKINALTPPWHDKTLNPIRLKKLNLEFAEAFDPYFKPLTVIPIQAETDNDGEGLLWIHDSSTYGNADNRNMTVYVRGMLVANNERDLLPSWAGFISGIYESNKLTPTASREDLVKDAMYYQSQQHLFTSLINGLSYLSNNEPEVWRAILRRHNEALIGAALADDILFNVLSHQLKIATSEGDLTLNEILKNSNNRIYVTLGEEHGSEEIVSRAMGVPIVNGYRYGAFAFCNRFAQNQNIELIQLGTSTGNKKLFPEISIEEDKNNFLLALFEKDQQKIIISEFEPEFLPSILFVDRDAELKSLIESDEADQKIASAALSMARMFTKKIKPEQEITLIINYKSSIIQNLLVIDKEKASIIATLIYNISQLIFARNTPSSNVKTTLENLAQTIQAIIGK